MCVIKRNLVLGLFVVFFFGAASLTLAEETKGKIASVNSIKNEVALTENFKNWTFQIDKTTKIFVNDRECRITELQRGDEAMVTFTRDGSRLVASIIRSMRQ